MCGADNECRRANDVIKLYNVLQQFTLCIDILRNVSKRKDHAEFIHSFTTHQV
jgi:hypothetical protein